MKRFLKKKWHRIPVGIVLVVMALMLVASSAFAAYNFLSFTTEISVDEPLTIEMAWYDYTDVNLNNPYGRLTEYWVVGDVNGDELTLDISPAETQRLAIRISNNSYGVLKIDTLFTGWIVDEGYITFDGWPTAASLTGTAVLGSDDNPLTYEWEGDVTITARGDTPPGIYTVNVKFTRE